METVTKNYFIVSNATSVMPAVRSAIGLKREALSKLIDPNKLGDSRKCGSSGIIVIVPAEIFIET